MEIFNYSKKFMGYNQSYREASYLDRLGKVPAVVKEERRGRPRRLAGDIRAWGKQGEEPYKPHWSGLAAGLEGS